MRVIVRPEFRQYVRPLQKARQSTAFCRSRSLVRTMARCCLVVSLAIFGVALLLCIGTAHAEFDVSPVAAGLKCMTHGCAYNDSTLRFLLIGDTGGVPVYPYMTLAQTYVRDTMVRMADEKKIQMVVNMGDNIYFTGVTNEFDSRFETSFENIYSHPSLDVPFYMISGNHDHFGNVSAQVAYTKYSHKWVYPDYYYKVNFTLADGTTIDLVMIDTIILCGNTADVEFGSIVELIWKGSKDPDGPKDEAAAEKQWEWIAKTLNESTADYLFVGGHYPVYSMSSHGPTACLVNRLQPMLEKTRVTAYFAGHDHTLQHIEVPSRDSSTHMHYIVSGAASRTDRAKDHIHSIPHDSLRFRYPEGFNPFSQIGFSYGALIYAEVSKENAFFSFMNGKGHVQYSVSLYPRGKEVVIPTTQPPQEIQKRSDSRAEIEL